MGKSHAPTPFTSVYRHFFTTMSRAMSRASTFFERERKLGPLQVLLTMQAAHVAGSHAGGQSWENALESVASSLGEDTAWGKRFSVSRTAFAQAVKKVDDAAQVDLWDMCRSLFPAAVGSTLSELHGIRFAHVDGTQVRTARSPELVKTVGVQSNGPSASAHYPSAKWVLVLEAGTQRILGHELCRCKAFDEEQEPVLAREERDGWSKLRDETLKSHAIIADCGFASYAEFADMIDEKQHFLIAVPKSWYVVPRSKRASKPMPPLRYRCRVIPNESSSSVSSPSKTQTGELGTSPPASQRRSPAANADGSTKPDGPSKRGSDTPNNSSHCDACAAPPCTAYAWNSSPSSSSGRPSPLCAPASPTTSTTSRDCSAP
jgi:hypothetical protein